jgi:DNA-directed RNA polymerase subunit alpha
MATARTEKVLDDLLAAPVDRDGFPEIVRQIYQSYTSVDLTHNRIRQMETRLELAPEEEKRDLSEKLGILLYAMGQYEEAAELLETVRTRKNAAHFLGRTYLQLERFEQAADCLQQGRRGDHDIETDALVVEAYCRVRDLDAARGVLKGYEGSDVESPYLDYAQGRVAEVDGEYAEAIELYEAALDKCPDHAESLFRLALNCDANGDDERAVELYSRCAEMTPTYIGPLMNLGVLHEDHGRYLEAIDCYKRVLAIAPRHKQARLYLKDAESSVTMHIDATKSRRLRRMEEILGLPVSGFELSARSRSCLDRMDIKTLGGLTRVTRDQLLKEKNFGDTSLDEIEGLLSRYNLELGENLMDGAPEPQLSREEVSDRLATSVDGLQFGTRSRRCFEALGVNTLGQLVQLTEADLLACPNFGETSLNEVKAVLALLGLSLRSD